MARLGWVGHGMARQGFCFTLEIDMEEEARVIGTRSVETNQLMEALRKAVSENRSEPIAYDELSNLIGRNVQGDGRGYLDSARRGIEQETGRLFGVVRKVGVKLLDPSEQATIAPDATTRIGRTAKRAITRGALVQTDKLSSAERLTHNAALSAMGVMYLASRPKSLAKIAEVAAAATDTLPVGDTLRLFGKG